MMPGKADKPTQNSALQGISEQENFMIKVLFVCHGNICRSTLAESVFTHKVTSLGLAHNFENCVSHSRYFSDELDAQFF